MRVFVTGATGFVGSAVVQELLSAGHQVMGLARTEEGAARLARAGAEVVRGSLEDTAGLAAAAARADAVAHLAFNHDFSQYARNAEDDRRAIEAMGAALEGSDRPLLVTSGVALLAPGRTATEHDDPQPGREALPRVSEQAARALAARGVRAGIVRLPPTTHGMGEKGFVPILAQVARQRGVAAYVGDGANRWPAAHRFDAAKVYRLALERGAVELPLHAVAEEGVPMKVIAEAIGKNLGLPVASIPAAQAAEHFGWFGLFAAADVPTSSAITRARLDWTPTETGLIEDISQPGYFDV